MKTPKNNKLEDEISSNTKILASTTRGFSILIADNDDKMQTNVETDAIPPMEE